MFQVSEPAESGAKELAGAAAAPEAVPASDAAAQAGEAQEEATPEAPAQAAEPEAAPAQQEPAEERGNASRAGGDAGALLAYIKIRHLMGYVM